MKFSIGALILTALAGQAVALTCTPGEKVCASKDGSTPYKYVGVCKKGGKALTYTKCPNNQYCVVGSKGVACV